MRWSSSRFRMLVAFDMMIAFEGKNNHFSQIFILKLSYLFFLFLCGLKTNPKMLKTIKAVAVLLLTILTIYFAGCGKPEDPDPGGNNSGQNDSVIDDSVILPVHDGVDLGLPSGTLWATCNVGADVPEGFGDFFAWGEVMPKDYYGWKNYQYGSVVNDRFQITKYCSDSCCGLNGFVDKLVVLELDDDAATVNWGEGWRMPTKEDWEELWQKTTSEWTSMNGVGGLLLTGWNGNSIFLPATGFRLDGELIGPGLGIYWSRSLHTGFPERGWSFHFDWESSHVCGTFERNRGQVVRAVR